jgi:hypothetical protein
MMQKGGADLTSRREEKKMRRKRVFMVGSLALFSVSWTAYSVYAKEPYASAEEYSKYIVNND